MKYQPSWIEIYKKKQGMVLQDLSLLATDAANGKIVAVGYEAKYLESPEVLVNSPLKDGRVAEWDASKKLFSYFLMRAGVGGKLFAPKPKIAVCMRPGATALENQAMIELMQFCGAKKVILSELPLAEFLNSGKEKDWDLVISIREE